MAYNRLQLNPSKTEVMWCASARRQQQTPIGPVRIGDTSVSSVAAVRDLGVYLAADVSMAAHVTATATACFAALRQIRSVWSSLPRNGVITMICASVVSKLDYCNSVLIGVSTTLQRRLQSVLNAATRLMFSARSAAHTMPLLRELHWLKVPERIQFRLCVLVLYGSAPQYLAETLQLTSDVSSRRRLRSGSTSTLLVPPTRRITMDDRAFPAATVRSWNALPATIRSASSYLTFRQYLKTFLLKVKFNA